MVNPAFIIIILLFVYTKIYQCIKFDLFPGYALPSEGLRTLQSMWQNLDCCTNGSSYCFIVYSVMIVLQSELNQSINKSIDQTFIVISDVDTVML